MPSTLALHLGAHKTATTTIQREFDERRRALLKLGVCYFGPTDLRGVPGLAFPSPQKVADGEAGPMQASTARTLARFVDEDLPRNTHRVLVSEENVLGSSRINLRRAQLYPALPDRLAALPAGWDAPTTEIFLSLRSYAGFFASCQSTVAILGDWMALGPDEQEDIAQLPRRWTDVVADIRAAFPRAGITVWRYEDLGRVGQTAVDAMVGAAFPVDFDQKGAMSSLSAEGMKRVREAYVANGRRNLDRDVIRQIRKETRDGFERYDPWMAHLRKALDWAYETDVEAIRAMPGVTVL